MMGDPFDLAGKGPHAEQDGLALFRKLVEEMNKNRPQVVFVPYIIIEPPYYPYPATPHRWVNPGTLPETPWILPMIGDPLPNTWTIT